MLANKTVNHSQTASCAMKPRSACAVNMATVVRTAPTMVTNITGFFTINRGSSFLNAFPIAGPTMFQSSDEGALCVTFSVIQSKQFSLHHQEVLHNRPQRQRGQRVQGPNQ